MHVALYAPPPDLPALMFEDTDTEYRATYYGRPAFAGVKSSFPLGRLPGPVSPSLSCPSRSRSE